MVVDNIDVVASMGLIPEFPVRPIEDVDSYHAVIAILDRLFLLENRRTPAQMEYFRALAELAFEYELGHDMIL